MLSTPLSIWNAREARGDAVGVIEKLPLNLL
jgi:hypothetical protein